MRKLFIFCSVFLPALFSTSPVFSQKLTVGILSGINFTQPQGYFTSGKWEVENGPVAGLFFNYRLTKILTVQTEFNFTVINYTHKKYNYPGYISYPMYLLSSSFAPYYYNNSDEKWEYNFYRIPLYLKLSTPTKLKLELAIGGYFSFRGKYEVPDYQVYMPYSAVYLPSDMITSYSTSEIPPKYDAGLFYSLGLAYPIAEDFNVYLNGRYFSGKRTYIESVSATNGAAELTFGLGYSGLFKSKNKVKQPEPAADSASHSLTVTPKAGISITGNAGSDNNNMYSNATGFSTGLSFMYRLSKHFALQSELLYERKGYELKGESNSFFKYTPTGYYTVDNRVNLDYVTIPILLNMRFGETFTVYFNAGIYAAMQMNARCTGTASNTLSGESSYQVYKTTVYDNIDGLMNSSDWGWALGSGIQYPVLKKYKLDLEFRYNKGFTNIYSNYYNATPVENEDTEIKNRSYVFTLGFQIPLN